MRRRSDFIVAFFIAVCVHCFAGVYTDKLLAGRQRESSLLAFREGKSAVDLTLLPAVSLVEKDKQEEKKEDQPAVKIPDAENIVQNQSSGEEDADLLEKGVVADYYGDADIRPRYPLGSRLRGEEGLVTIKVVFGSDGDVDHIEIVKSSGYGTLDAAADRAVRAWVDKRDVRIPVACEVERSFRFVLTD